MAIYMDKKQRHARIVDNYLRLYFGIMLVISSITLLLISPQQVLAQTTVTAVAGSIDTLVEDAIEALQNGDTNRAMVHLKLADQQLTPSVKTSTVITKRNNDTIGSSDYNNPTLGIKIRHPPNWSVVEYPYDPAITANNTVVTFLSPSKTASALGNISGISGSFVPYVDIFTFASKNMSLAEVLNKTMSDFSNTTVYESKPFTLKGNNPAEKLVYSVKVARDELFKKMQIYTIKNDKVYVITYTAEASLYPNYLPTVQTMMDSLEIRDSTTRLDNNNNDHITKTLTTANQQQPSMPTTSGETTTSNTSSIGIPGLP